MSKLLNSLKKDRKSPEFKQEVILALDAMGGDHAPSCVVEGAHIAFRKNSSIKFQFYGDQVLLEPLLEKYKALKAVSTLIHTNNYISNEDKASAALRKSKDSSMRLAIEAVSSGKADGVVSSGNSGAYMAISKMILKTIAGIDRPAIASLFPTQRGASVMLDMGANLQCDVDNLLQFAIMGNVYARDVLNIEHPTIGLLNVGAEELKGHPSIQQAAQLLRKLSSVLSFHGYIEGDDISYGTVDVIVTDGFSGNVAIKTAEGISRMMSKFLKEAMVQTWASRIGLLFSVGALRRLKSKFDPRHYNGAIFIGLNGVAVKSHGSADSYAFANAIGVAANMVSHGFNQQIESDLQKVETLLIDQDLNPEGSNNH
jgi:glycerol-3-phosphate acyltransferase PlsX